MLQYVTATEEWPGWWVVRFKFDRDLVDAIKSVPGMRWDKDRKVWRGPGHAIPVVESILTATGRAKVNRQPYLADAHGRMDPVNFVDIGPGNTLRDYQIDGVTKLMVHSGFALTMEPRTGKTPTACHALANVFAYRLATRAIIIYPNGVRQEWERQLPRWSGGLKLSPIFGEKNLGNEAFTPERWPEYTVLGVHHEVLGRRIHDVLAFANLGLFTVMVDEAHLFANRKAPRTVALLEIAKHVNCQRRWWITGTPMRNYPANTWPLFEFCTPNGTSGFWGWAKRYADAHQNERGHWVFKGKSNEEELRARLAAISHRVTRAEAAAWLPKSERVIIRCDLNKEQRKAYNARERAFGSTVGVGLQSGHFTPQQIDAMRILAVSTAEAKYGQAIERISYHADGRQVKVLVGAVHHETLQTLAQKLGGFYDETTDQPLVEENSEADLDHEKRDPHELPKQKAAPVDAPIFVAGGWLLPEKRREVIEAWRAVPGAAVILVNMQASGVGIDLSDADCTVALELPWVPSDAQQFEDRIQDVHQGKRKSPPLYEYLVARGTVDEDVAVALINKMNAIQTIVGKTESQTGLRDALQQSGVADESRLSLASTEEAVVDAALDAFRARLLGEEDPFAADEASALAATLAEEDEKETEEDGEAE